MTQTSNRLKSEKSLYLKQHEENPVHWWAYGEEALAFASKNNRPIFLSIGYSSCHWCHVMAHESFESEEIAEILNQHFVPIKVDREEYPDLDQYYQQASLFFTQHGGWPLSAFLLPDLRPFFVGTYFPKHPRPGLSSFKEVLLELKRAFHEEKDLLEKNAAAVTESIAKGLVIDKPYELQGHFPSPSSILEALKDYEDKEWGGHGDAPKFPHFAFLEWSLEQILEGMVSKDHGEHAVMTIEHMLCGGIFDHARGGMHRYATDKMWLIPHFEKMLYDQSGLIRVLAKLSLIYPGVMVFESLKATLQYVEAEMMSEEGYFFSAQDADSEGVEGLFFSFTEDEFEDVVNNIDDEKTEEKLEQIKKWFRVTKAGNFEHGLNVISLDPKFKDEYLTPENFEIIRKVRSQILNVRKERIPPLTDSKGIASWNFHFLSSLLDVMQFCRMGDIRAQAMRLFQKGMEGAHKTFVKTEGEGKEATSVLRHVTTKENSISYFEDYVAFLELQLRTYEMTGDPIFKNNFKITLELILKEFLENNAFLTRSKTRNSETPYPNQKVSNFDSSFKSPSASFLGLVRKGAVLFAHTPWLESIQKAMEQMIQETLRNPVGSGEALRSLTYPPIAYRVVKVPKKWINDPKFMQFQSYFMPRFTFDYHESGDEWQICSMNSCDLSGNGIDEFVDKLTPKKAQ